MEFTLDEADSRTEKEVEHRLQEALARLREEHECQSRTYREDLEAIYESKVSKGLLVVYG